MAIIKELGLEVKIKVNGSAAAEYTDEEPDIVDNACSQTTETCYRYVESVDNAEFAIHVGLIPGTNTGQEWISRSSLHRLSFAVAFDGGHKVASQAVFQHQSSRLLEGIHNRENQTLRKFRFAPVSTVDDANKERITTDMEVAQNLGLIRVCIRRGIWKKVAEQKTRSSHGPKLDPKLGTDSLSLAEKALKGKAISHGTALSAPVKSSKKSSKKFSSDFSWHVDWTDRDTSPLAIFYFKYRSKEALQQELIITRPRSLSMESDLENLSPDEVRRLALERLSQMKNGKKRARSVKDEDNAEVVKPDRPFKYVKIQGGKKAIDLTEDD